MKNLQSSIKTKAPNKEEEEKGTRQKDPSTGKQTNKQNKIK